MAGPTAEQIKTRANSVLASMAAHCNQNGLGSMSPSIYDTAWVSMVRKPCNGGHWLIPEAFSFLLASQSDSGGWASYASPADGILNTAAALLSLKRHLVAGTENEAEKRKDWSHRIEIAELALKQMLATWDLSTCDQVGFELLIIQHITLLEAEGVQLDCPNLQPLRVMRDAKLAKLSPEFLYQGPSTLYHSLEALIGYLDFDRLRCWRDSNGSMMGSPSSTAAYLMEVSTWDSHAEEYLRQVVQLGSGHGDGSVPSAWPINVFEVTWVATTLMEAGVVATPQDSEVISTFLQTSLSAHDGILGFSPGFFADADDTAKAITTLFYLGQADVMKYGAESLIRAFEADTHFRTYPGERNASLSANCNVLICLMNLSGEDKLAYVPQIAKSVSFLTEHATTDKVRDKWNMSEFYWMMLLSHVYWLLCRDDERLQAVIKLAPGLRHQMPMLSCHILIRILHSQRSNGSWDDMCEVTSYAILALSWLSRLPSIYHVEASLNTIHEAMARAQHYLCAKQPDWAIGEYLWIEKVSYSSDLLSETYCLAACMTPLPANNTENVVLSTTNLIGIPQKVFIGMRKASEAMSLTPLFTNMNPLYMRIAEIQACHAFLSLQGRPEDAVFPRTAKGKDKYLFILPLSFTACAAAQGCHVGLSILYEMMRLAILNFHADEYMEGVIEQQFNSEGLEQVRAIVREVFAVTNFPDDYLSAVGPSSLGRYPDSSEDGALGDIETSLEGVRNVLSHFIRRVLGHPAVLSSLKVTQKRLAKEMEVFLLAHLTQAGDNRRFLSQRCGHANDGCGDLSYHNAGRTYHAWIRGSSADSTSCPFSFVFYNCLLAYPHSVIGTKADKSPRSNKDNVFETSALASYAAEEMCRHLANMCRMYNDAGSIQRDYEEGNLNSINFPEFCERKSFEQATDPMASVGCGDKQLVTARKNLLDIAEFERHQMENSFGMLHSGLEGKPKCTGLANALRLFINVTDLYGQIYIIKDVGTRTK